MNGFLVGYRTYIAAALMAGFGALAQFDWVSFLSNPKAGLVALISAVIMAILRSITTTPPLTKPDSKS